MLRQTWLLSTYGITTVDLICSPKCNEFCKRSSWIFNNTIFKMEHVVRASRTCFNPMDMAWLLLNTVIGSIIGHKVIYHPSVEILFSFDKHSLKVAFALLFCAIYFYFWFLQGMKWLGEKIFFLEISSISILMNIILRKNGYSNSLTTFMIGKKLSG